MESWHHGITELIFNTQKISACSGRVRKGKSTRPPSPQEPGTWLPSPQNPFPVKPSWLLHCSKPLFEHKIQLLRCPHLFWVDIVQMSLSEQTVCFPLGVNGRGVMEGLHPICRRISQVFMTWATFFKDNVFFFSLEALDERIFSLPRAAAGQIERDSSSKPTEQSTVWREVQDSVQKNK